jgi:hypothetical protein
MSEEELNEIKTRLRALEDERAIHQLISRYGHYIDLGYEDSWVGQFTDDGAHDLVTIVRNGVGYIGNKRFQGHAELYENIRDPAAHKAMEGRSLHVQDMNLMVSVDGDRAQAESYSMTLLREGDETVVRSAGMIRWTLRRISGRWYIAEKRRRPPGDPDLYAGIQATPGGILPGTNV